MLKDSSWRINFKSLVIKVILFTTIYKTFSILIWCTWVEGVSETTSPPPQGRDNVSVHSTIQSLPRLTSRIPQASVISSKLRRDKWFTAKLLYFKQKIEGHNFIGCLRILLHKSFSKLWRRIAISWWSLPNCPACILYKIKGIAILEASNIKLLPRQKVWIFKVPFIV